jgi:hypothetical protein
VHKLGVWIIIVACVLISMLMDLVHGLDTHVKYVVAYLGLGYLGGSE